ncbi:DUF2332 domain-containing protein [Kribbella sp. NBC_00709]|uniref:DUF2332 domain-containing protein n=1 Tax=Kribbella sp. NBC_00709 TaxID=2975972 RepID=UPI002E2CD9B0|nr:DUF2332 domain-containing protein [Kribbella sp. NBC_00709]
MGRKLAQMYRRYAEVDAAKISPLYERLALALSESDAALHAIETAPARKRHPALILAALHNLALTGQAPSLTAAYAAVATDAGLPLAASVDAAVVAAVEALVGMTDAVVSVVAQRKVRGNATGNHALLYPAIAEVARRVGASSVGLVDVGSAPGFNLNVDRAGISHGNGQSLGDPSSPVQVSASIVGDRPVPTQVMPEVVARIGVDLEPIDTTNADEARWLRACLPPDQPERITRLEGELELAATAPPLLVRGEAVEVLSDALARVPADALPVVITTWALSDLSLESRLRFLQRLDEAATERPVAWVSVEGVGVAPAIPTFGDRHASGHSIIGLAVFGHSTLRAEAVGRCWLRGQMLAWLGSD